MDSDELDQRNALRSIVLEYVRSQLSSWGDVTKIAGRGRLAGTAFVVKNAARFLWSIRSGGLADHVERLEVAAKAYSELTGRPVEDSEDDLDELTSQLIPLLVWTDLSMELPGADPFRRRDVLGAADALIAYRLQGNRTDDTLLEDVMTAYWRMDQDQDETLDRIEEMGPTAALRGARRRGATGRALLEEYRVAWNRWFEARGIA